jgi:hypothetical protein
LEIRLDPSASAWDEWKRAFKELKALLKHDEVPGSPLRIW